MCRNGACAAIASIAAINSASTGLAKPRSSTAPSAIASREGRTSGTLSNRSAVNTLSLTQGTKLLGIVKDHAHGMTVAGAEPADAMAQINAVEAARPLHRP